MFNIQVRFRVHLERLVHEGDRGSIDDERKEDLARNVKNHQRAHVFCDGSVPPFPGIAASPSLPFLAFHEQLRAGKSTKNDHK